MQSFFLPFRTSRIHYLLGGRGSKILCCFHGYGRSAESFIFLEQALEEEYTILAIDLPFHGKTDWKEGLFFDPEMLISLIGQMVDGLPGSRDGWALLGYSMGGRVALGLLEKIPEKVEKLVLLAPDGLTVNSWYWWSTHTKLGNVIFRWTMQKPGWLFFLLRLGNALQLVNRSVYKFTVFYTEDAAVRQELYARWTTMRGFKPDTSAIRALIRKRPIPIRFLYGQHDRIIRPVGGEKFRKGMESYCRLTLVPMGHQLLQAKNLGVIVSSLKE